MEDGYLSNDLKQHCLNTKKFCEDICTQMGVRDSKRYLLNAAEIHDLGKYFIPKYIIEAPRPLQLTERFIVDMHSSCGYLKAKEIGYDELTCQIILLHHGLKKNKCLAKESLLQEALELYPILMAADIYDALRTDRPYRPPVDKLNALDIVADKEEISQNIVNALSVIEGIEIVV